MKRAWSVEELHELWSVMPSDMERLPDKGSWLPSPSTRRAPPARMVMQILGCFAEFERSMVGERTRAGLDAARAQGHLGGRRPKLKPDQADEVRKMVLSGRKSAADAARLFRVHPSTISRLLAQTPPRASTGRASRTSSRRA